MERPRHARPLRSSVNTLFVLLLGAAIGYSAYPMLNALRSSAPADTTPQAKGPATPPVLEGEEPLDAVVWPGRHLMIGIAGTELDDATRALLAHVRPGGVILRGENLRDRKQVLALVDEIKAATGLGSDDTALPLIAANLEGVNVQGLGIQPAPAVATLASMGNVDTARKLGRSYAAEYAELGFAMVFSPILDVYNPETFAQHPDTYDENHAEATKMALAFLGGAREGGVIPIGEGFPGRGAAKTSGTSAVPALDHDRYQLAKIMYSFIEAVSGDEKIPAVVVEHVAVPALDSELRPASLSPVLVKTVLRDTCGYEGVVIAADITSDAAMASEPTERVAVQALVAGCDAVIMSEPDPKAILDVCKAIQTAVFLYTLPSNQLASSKARLDSLQNWLRASDRVRRGEEAPTTVAKAPLPDVPVTPVETPTPPPPTVAISKEDVPETPPVDDTEIEESTDAAAPDEESSLESDSAETEAPAETEADDTAPGPDMATPDGPTEHVVGENESLAVIANLYGITVKNLLTWNGLIEPKVEPGQVLRIAPPPAPEEGADEAADASADSETPEPVPDAETGAPDGEPAAEPAEEEEPAAEKTVEAEATTTYTVAPGDTLYRIAVKHNTTPERLLELNNLKNADVVVLGSKLKVPAK